jgi:hypothetical protein
MDDTHTTDEATNHATHRRRILLGIAIVLVLAILALTPPLINLNRLQRRITVSMSASLGRQVFVDPGTTFHIFPIPGFTLKNLVVSEDPAFGNEPVIRANEVTAELRLSSLWRHQVEFSKITFDVDPDGSGASLNLVRNPDGQWNIASLLMQASRIDAAPTTQKRPGATPRFPYIEAKGARINLKLGDEKMPFSLTDAEFALWLPTAQQWRFQLRAKPSRTDSNVGDPGEIRAEGSMRRATVWSSVPIDMHASWHDAPLGEASRLLTGNDAGWRGTLQLDTDLRGTLGAAQLTTNLTLNDLRRTEFIPTHPLDISVNCTASTNVLAALVETATCHLPDGAPEPAQLEFTNADFGKGTLGHFGLTAKAAPLNWLYGWFKVLAPRTPQDLQPTGTVDTLFTRDTQGTWDGNATITLPTTTASTPNLPSRQGRGGAEPTADELAPNTQPADLKLNWTILPTPLPAHTTTNPTTPCTPSLELTPASIPPGADQNLTISGTLTPCGYTYQATGQTTTEALTTLGAKLPTLADGLLATLPPDPGPQHLNTTCTRTWGTPQTCTAQKATPATRKKTHHR